MCLALAFPVEAPPIAHGFRGSSMDLKNRWVDFRVRDVYLPDPGKILMDLFGDHLLQGRVLDLSDSGESDGQYVVVEVEDLKDPLIVPVKCILGYL